MLFHYYFIIFLIYLTKQIYLIFIKMKYSAKKDVMHMVLINEFSRRIAR